MKEIVLCNILAATIVAAVLIPLAAYSFNGTGAPDKQIYKAARKGGSNLRGFLAKGHSINESDAAGRTALMQAAARNKPHVARVLINNGANVNQQNAAGETALMLAAQRGAAAVAKLLLTAQANPHIKNRKGETALQKAKHPRTLRIIDQTGRTLHGKS